MYDVHVIFNDLPGELARFRQLLGQHGVGLEGGGVFGQEAHFLVEEGEKARQVLTDGGFNVQAVRKPIVRKLRQERPGELGGNCRRAGRCGRVCSYPIQRPRESPYSADR